MVKKILGLFVVLAFTSVGLFAQNAKYDDLLKKAKDAEKNKEYVYAMGYYYDAMEVIITDNSVDVSKACEGFKKITDAVLDGKPGLDNYNAFTLHDEWVRLLNNAEKYFTEYPYYGFKIPGLVQESLDYATKTATYVSEVFIYKTKKGNAILNPILSGLKKVRVTDWEDIPEDWPMESVHVKSGHPKDIYTKEKTALYCTTRDGIPGTGKNTPIKDSDTIRPMFMIHSYVFRGNSNLNMTHALKPYDITLEVCDKSGKKLIDDKSPKVIVPMEANNSYFYDNYNNFVEFEEEKYIEFKISSVTPDIIGIIDSGEYIIKPTSIKFNYGTYRGNSWKSNNVYEVYEEYASTQIPIEKVEFAIQEQKEKTDVSVVAPGIQYANSLYTKEYIDKELMVKIEDTLEVAKFETTQALYSLIMRNNPSAFVRDTPNGERQVLRPVESVTWYEAIIFCNELTKKYMNESDCVYELSEIKMDNDYYDGRIAEATVSWDKTKNGFRLPTEEEWKKSAEGTKASADNSWNKFNSKVDKFIDIIDFGYSGRGQKKSVDIVSHEVGKKHSNKFGLYDMFGNVSEMCWKEKFLYCYGGNFSKDEWVCNNSIESPDFVNEAERDYTVGFRVVRNHVLTEAEKAEIKAAAEKAAAEKAAAEKAAAEQKAAEEAATAASSSKKSKKKK